MNSNRSLIVLGAIVFALVSTLFFKSGQLHADVATSDLKAAPAWKLENLDGVEVSSDSFRGKVIVVDFWATWCPPCIAEIPGYIEMQKKYAEEGLVIVGISLDQKGPEHVKKFAAARGLNYIVVMGDEEVAEAFGGIEAIPTTFLIDRAGRIVHQKKGAMAHADYEKLVKQALQ